MTGATQAMLRNANRVAVALSATSVSKSGATSTLNTGSVTGTASKGSPPYTYAWTISATLAGGSASPGPTISVLSPTKATTAFGMSGGARGVIYTATAHLTVTDNLGNSVVSQDVAISIVRS